MNQGFKCLKANGSHPETMPPNLRADHATPQKSLLDRIYLDRRFKTTPNASKNCLNCTQK